MYEWENIPWRQLEVQVFKLQKRIYRASERGDVKQVRRLQRLLVKSRAAKLLAISRVTQDHQGKSAAGIDRLKSIHPARRLKIAEDLKRKDQVSPIRRVWIPKLGALKKRTLRVSTIEDKAKQTLAKLALEPEWEALFEPHSYGFRPGRSIHDAVKYIKLDIQRKDKYVFNADISKCFDGINYSALLNKLNTFPLMRRQIKAWLKAGVMEGKTLFPTEEGTPQPEVISPLLANIALHGLENYLNNCVPKQKNINGEAVNWELTVVRYADNFLIMHRDLNQLKIIKSLAEKWLNKMGLKLSSTPTKIVHTFEFFNGQEPSFDFLGFSFHQYQVGKRNCRLKAGESRAGGQFMTEKIGSVKQEAWFKTIITPTQAALQRHQGELSQIIDQLKTVSQSRLIRELNSVIQGWANYYCAVNSKEVFSDIDRWLWRKLRRWALRRHPMKPAKWVFNKYWHVNEPEGTKRWDFNDGETSLLKHRHAFSRE